MNSQQTIPCPTRDCGTQIPFDPYRLLEGVQFVCPKCQAAIGLAPESRGTVKEGLQKFEAMKREVLSMKKKEPR